MNTFLVPRLLLHTYHRCRLFVLDTELKDACTNNYKSAFLVGAESIDGTIYLNLLALFISSTHKLAGRLGMSLIVINPVELRIFAPMQ